MDDRLRTLSSLPLGDNAGVWAAGSGGRRSTLVFHIDERVIAMPTKWGAKSITEGIQGSFLTVALGEPTALSDVRFKQITIPVALFRFMKIPKGLTSPMVS
jgi:hypothetical protein